MLSRLFRRSLEVINCKLLQHPQRPALVYVHFWSPTMNQGQASFWNHTVQPGAQGQQSLPRGSAVVSGGVIT